MEVNILLYFLKYKITSCFLQQNDASIYRAPSELDVGFAYIVTFTSEGQPVNKYRLSSNTDVQTQIINPGTFMTDVSFKCVSFFAVWFPHSSPSSRECNPRKI